MAKAQIKPDYKFLPLKQVNVGKVRETFEVDEKHFLIVTTDRISALDYVLHPDSNIDGKGIVLNQMSIYFMSRFIPNNNHLVDTDIDSIARGIPDLKQYADQLRNRVVLVEKLSMFPVESIVRGYLMGSVVDKYNEDDNGLLLGHNVGRGLKSWQKFPNGSIYTPSTKAEFGSHDANITRDRAKEIMEAEGFAGYSGEVEKESLRLYNAVYEHALEKGIIFIDTKIEWGINKNGVLTLGDEFGTPDSSRFVAVDEYVRAMDEGRDPQSLDKEPVRRVVRAGKKQLALEGREVVQQEFKVEEKDRVDTVGRYTDIYFLLLGADYNPSATKQLMAVRKKYGFST